MPARLARNTEPERAHAVRSAPAGPSPSASSPRQPMQTAVARLQSELTARFGPGRRYDNFCDWLVRDHAQTRLTLYWDGKTLQAWRSDRAAPAPRMIGETATPGEVPPLLKLMLSAAHDNGAR
jgi:hypothetical protein